MNLSKILKLDLNYFLKKGFWIYNAYLISVITGLILTFFYGNYLTKEVFGKFSFVLSILSLVTFFSLPGMNQALTQGFFKEKFGNYRLALRQTLKISLIGSVIILMIGTYYLNHDLDLFVSLILISILFPFIAISTYYQSFIIRNRNFKLLSLINILNYLLTFITTILAIILKLNLFGLILSSLLPSLFINISFTILYLSRNNSKIIDPTYIRMGYHLSLSQSLHFLTKSIDKILLGFNVPFASLALYTIALIIPEQVNNFTKQIIPLLIPKIAELKEKDIRKDIIKKFYQLELIIIFVIILYFLTSKLIFSLVFTQYLEGVKLSQLYSLTLIILPTNILNLVFQRRKLNYIFYIQETFLATTLLLGIVLTVPKLGIEGAIYSHVFSKICYTLLTIFLFKKYIK